MNVLENPERGKKIAEIQKIIGEKIAENILQETENKVNQIISSDRPQSKVFQGRRNRKLSTNSDFPLKDMNRVLQVSKDYIQTLQ